MNAKARRVSVGACGVAAMVLGAVSIAFACSPSAYLTVEPNAGGAGSDAIAHGSEFVNGGPVKIFWNSTGGPVLATTSGPSFSVPITIPANANPGANYVYAVGYNGAGEVAGVARWGFRVTEPTPAPRPSVGTPGSSAAPGQTAPTPAPRRAAGPASAGPQPASRARTAAPPAGAAQPAPAAPAGVPQQSVAVGQGPLGSPATVNGDIWGGFESGVTAAGPSLVDGRSGAVTQGSQFALGVAMLSLGLVVLAAGTLIAVVDQRRKALVGGDER